MILIPFDDLPVAEVAPGDEDHVPYPPVPAT
jgi:hypothetical protein